MLFSSISPSADFFKKLQLQLDIINKNILYITHECDKIKKLVVELGHDKDLQDTVDKYFDRDEPTVEQKDLD